MTTGRLLQTWLLCAVALLSVAGSAAAARKATRRVAVRVVEVAGGHAYLESGAADGIRRGDAVVIDKRRFEVVAVSAHNAVVEQRRGQPKLHARGSVRVRARAAEASGRLPPPAPLDAYRGQWARARVPARDQTPTAVPLGRTSKRGTTRALLSLGGGAVIPIDDPGQTLGRGRARARLHHEPLSATPLSFDVDATGQLWLADGLSSRAGSGARVPLFVRELSIRYGQPRGLHAALGRLRYASQMLGMLDGVRTQAPLGAGLTASAFGGSVPDPLDGAPAVDVSRFGGELAWENLELGSQPRLAVGAHGSYFDGAVDERRVHALADLYPEFGRVGAHVQLAFLDEDNPWNAPTSQVSSAGLDALVDTGPVAFGARADIRRPERSRWLAQFVAPQWLCTATAGGGTPDCDGDELFYGGQLDARIRGERVLWTIGASADATTVSNTEQLGGFSHLRILRVWETLRIESSASYHHGSLQRGGRVLVGLGADFAGGAVDIGVRYQPGYVTYQADVGNYLEHEAGLTAVVLAGTAMDITVAADFITGRDVNLVLVQSMLNYRY